MQKSLIFLVLLVSCLGVAQQDSMQKIPISEIKVNLFNLATYTAVHVSYEYLLNENQSLGMGLLFKLKPVKGKEKVLFEPEIR